MADHVFPNYEGKISRVGLGGEGVLRTTGKNGPAREVVETAVDMGIAYFDSARVYMDSELYYGQYWKEHPGKREKVFHTSKSAQRTREGAFSELSQTLDRLNTDYLDLWQIHDIRDPGDIEAVSQKGGALEAFTEAREMGLVRHIGVTGHHDPAVLTRAVEAWPVDAVLMPVNPVEEILGGFLTQTLAAARKKGIAVIGMKVLGGKHYISEDLGITPELLVRFALSQDIDVALVGCSSGDEVRSLVRAGQESGPAMSPDERQEIMKPFFPMARKLAFYRGSLFNKP
ncbi:aldo/keto reductase [Desulfospira joergensenii]|uniref:aldo/keto reductase n=1 Tax=Desulfospira joergensenii TaxID=53329 RepID=UPI0003B57EDF|nr:aldo/keto reductase [Desulfospira joergensenii]